MWLAMTLAAVGCQGQEGSQPPKVPAATPAPEATKAPAAGQAASQPSAPAAAPQAASQPSAPPVAASQPAGEGEAERVPGAHAKAPPRPEATKVHGLTNISGVQYVNAACTAEAPCKCKGALVYGDNALAKVGVTKEVLAEGAWCVFGDFDGNSFADIAVLGATWSPGGPAADVQVLLFDNLGLRATTPLPKRMKSLARAVVGEQQVLIEPAAGQKYYFAYSESGQFELKKR